MSLPRLFIGIACHKPTSEFMDSLGKFLPSLSERYKITNHEVWGEELVVAQNKIANTFLASHTDWLLMLEDDHSGHTVEMVDDLINSGHRFCMMRYHTRHYPYVIAGLNYDHMGIKVSNTKYYPVDLIGFGMTMIHRSVFEDLDKPYFRNNCGNEFNGSYATDKNFSKRCLEVGIQPYICNTHCLDHRGINSDNCVDKFMEYSCREEVLRKLNRKAQVEKVN
jgi:hypothetical protein